MENKRIAALDGLRAIAVLMVVLYHYFARWTIPLNDNNLYPYGDILSGTPFKFGSLGVEIFFIISGFVISLTLASCTSIKDFAIKRFARLWPAMFLCSIITFAGLQLIPLKLFQVSAANFIPSLMFIDPELMGNMAITKGLGWMDGAYWSLFVEVRFYLWAVLLFFINKPNFLRTFLIFLNISLVIRGLDGLVPGTATKDIIKIIFFPRFLPWFTAGIAFYYLSKDKNNRLAHASLLEGFILILTSAHSAKAHEIPFYFAIFALFYIFIYKPNWLKFLEWRPFSMIGAASYSLYLLHQSLGVTLIAYLANVLGINSTSVAILIAFGVLFSMVFLSLAIFKLWETPSKNLIIKLYKGLPGADKEAVLQPA